MHFRLLERLHALIRRAYPRHVRDRDERRLEGLLQEMLNGSGADQAGRRRILIRAIADAAKTLPRAWLVELSVGGARYRTASRRRPNERMATMHERAFSHGLGHDFRSAVRATIRQPGFAIFVSFTLALGIGANAAVFSVLHSVLLAPMPYTDAGRLVRIYLAERGDDRNYVSKPAFTDFRERLTSVRIAAINNYGGREFGADIILEGRAERVRRLPVSADYFEVLGANVVLGRPFSREDERGDAPVVISERLWRRAMQSDPDAIGKSLILDGVSHRVSGVASSAFTDPIVGMVDVWSPQNVDFEQPWEWENTYLTVYGRLAPGVTLERARAEVMRRSGVHRELAGGMLDDDYHGVLIPLHDDLVRSAEPMLLVLMGAVAVLLLITCTNVTALVLARGVTRSRELSIRAALGSGRARLVRQLVIESLVLASIAAVAGLVAGALVQRALIAVAPAALPEATAIGYGWPVALFSGALALVVGLVVGGLPALQVTRRGLEAGVSNEVRAGSDRAEHQRMRRTLVVAEVSLAMVLLVGGGLLLSSLQRLRSLDLGVDVDDVWTFQVHLPDARYSEPQERVRFHAALHERVRSIPGVESVGAASRLPATGHYHGPWGTRADTDDARTVMGAQHRVIQGDWFDALDIELIEGRLFGPQDGPDAPRRVVVSEDMARALFPGESALGRRVVALGNPLAIIGVIEAVPLTPRGQPAPTVYHAHAQFASNRNWALFQVVEMSQPVPGVIESARAELGELDPNLVLVEPERLTAVLGRESARETFATLVISIFAALAVSLAALGIYSILSYDVSRSRHDIAVRLALGAGGAQVRGMVVRRGLVLTALGVAVGTLGALAQSRVLDSLLFEISPHDPLVVGAAALLVLLIGSAASWIPARRATSVEPAEAFRGT